MFVVVVVAVVVVTTSTRKKFRSHTKTVVFPLLPHPPDAVDVVGVVVVICRRKRSLVFSNTTCVFSSTTSITTATIDTYKNHVRRHLGRYIYIINHFLTIILYKTSILLLVI